MNQHENATAISATTTEGGRPTPSKAIGAALIVICIGLLATGVVVTQHADGARPDGVPASTMTKLKKIDNAGLVGLVAVRGLRGEDGLDAELGLVGAYDGVLWELYSRGSVSAADFTAAIQGAEDLVRQGELTVKKQVVLVGRADPSVRRTLARSRYAYGLLLVHREAITSNDTIEKATKMELALRASIEKIEGVTLP